MNCDSSEEGFRSLPTDTASEADRISKELEEEYLARSSADPETLESLISLADEIQQVLVPVKPQLGFREWLRDRLSAVLRQRLTWRVVQPSEDHRWIFILGVAVGSLVPLLGVVMAYLLRSRWTGRPQHARAH